MPRDTSLLGVTVGLLILSAFFFLIERLLGRRRRTHSRRGWVTDLCFWFFTPLVTKWLTRLVLLLPIGLLVALGLASFEEFKLREYRGFGPIGAQPLWLQIVEIYLLADLVGYWSHRLFHRGRWWPFHAVHHSSEDVDWLSSVRVHPVNDLVTKFAQVTPLLLLGFNPLATLSAAPFFTLYSLFLHADVDWDLGPLRGIIASPVFHRWHHCKEQEAWDKNFAGLFSFWDRIFGTYFMPPGRVPETFGLVEEFPKDFVGQLTRPFVGTRKLQPGESFSSVTTAAAGRE